MAGVGYLLGHSRAVDQFPAGGGACGALSPGLNGACSAVIFAESSIHIVFPTFSEEFGPRIAKARVNLNLMERWAIRKRLRQVYRLLLDSKAALEAASDAMRDRWVKDTLFVMSCRRLIMMNLLDRELGSLEIKLMPKPEASHHFDELLVAGRARGIRPVVALLGACQEEENYLVHELEDLRFQPGLSGRTRQIITELIHEAEENVHDLSFAAQAGQARA